ncbi:MAG TPA: hypothetical protein VHZ31_07305 [Solirubrobacteraceae bacterium]|nr:hypothetical protein [Solirubrobacteraceae bacterium]
MTRTLAGMVAVIGALVVFAAPAQALTLQQRLIGAGGGPGDLTGLGVDVDGDTAVVGSPHADGKGAVYVFTRSGDSWTQTAKLTTSDLAAGDDLGESVAIDGDTIVAGAPGANHGPDDRVGAVYTFARAGTANRQETAKLTVSDGAAFDNLGETVAIDGDGIVAGAAGETVDGKQSAGALYTFTRTGVAARTETGKLIASVNAESDQLGRSLAVDGDTIVAGADIGVGGDVGKVYTFARTGASPRTETAVLTASDGGQDDLGESVAIDGDTIVAGAPTATVAGVSSGAVYTFTRTGGARTETARLTASDGAKNDGLGESAAIDGDTIYAGAPFNDGQRGTVYTFARTGVAARTQTGKLTASDGEAFDRLGDVGLAVDAGTVIAGAPFDDVGANADQGSAVVFYAGTAATSYANTVLADTPAGYWRFGEPSGTTALDSSGHANNGSYINGPMLGVPGALAGDPDTAVSLDGVNDVVRVPDSNTLDVGNTFSAEGWIKRGSTAKTTSMMLKGFQIVVMSAANGNQVWLRKPNVSTIARTNAGVGAGAYHQIVVTKNGSGPGTVKIYIDGAPVAVVDVSAVQVIQDTSGPLQFGDIASTQAAFDEFALYDQVLTPAQVAAHYAAGT